MKEENEVYHGSGNVFADMGLPDAEERLAKANLSLQIQDILKQQKPTQAKAAELLGIDQPKVSALMRGKLSGFSMERLFHLLNILGRDIHIVVKPKSLSTMHGGLHVAIILSLSISMLPAC